MKRHSRISSAGGWRPKDGEGKMNGRAEVINSDRANTYVTESREDCGQQERLVAKASTWRKPRYNAEGAS